jgi:hypothetical protein
MKTTEELVLEAGGIQNLEIFSGISQFNGNEIEQLAVVTAPERVAEVVVVRGYRRTVTRGGGGSSWNWNDTNGGQNDGQGGGGEETWTLISETNTYANRANYYCSLHNTPSIGTKTNFFAAASRVMKLYKSIDVLSDNPSGIPGDRPSSAFLRYNSDLSQFLRNIVNPWMSNLIATNAPPYNTMTVRQRDVALVEQEQEFVQTWMVTISMVNPSEYNEFVTSANLSFFAVDNMDGFLGIFGVTQDANRAINLAADRAGGSLDFRNKADRIKIGLAFIDGVVEDAIAGRAEC